ncbi:hypothetical protein [Variovorax terrae]|uniref:Uncharacterized protein n=1 Tax=Variovorax terrae TaxID=2923278 RepID=A0A9X2AQJ3_9BURK|nr:hypothetical protein [Variovorax terrae]MCJ0766070.1 hypothetical protein [Variovorax terrae]
MKKTFAVALTAMALASPTLSFAQFGNMLGNLTGNKSSGGNAGADMGAQQDQLVRTYMAAGKDIQTANGHMAAALGINAQAVDAAATSDSLSAKDIEAQDKAISANAAAQSEALKSGATLKDAEAKTRYAQGLLSLATGVKKYMDLGKDAQGFSSGLSSVSPMQLGKLESGAYIVKNLPGSVSNLTSVLRRAIDFAKNNGVDIPREATSLL